MITRRGLERVRAAEVVVYDRLVHPDLLEEAPPWAERIFVGKRPGSEGHSLPQDQINTLLIETARGGRRHAVHSALGVLTVPSVLGVVNGGVGRRAVGVSLCGLMQKSVCHSSF